MTPVDKVFTRIGASDNILEGKSTFYIEMEETKAILEQATRNSLVVMDELGRGTSTFDGQAIADAVLEHLVKVKQCRTLFSTHYHNLQEKYARDRRVEICRMAYLIPEGSDKLIYLYKLEKGKCSSSFGLNIARIAGLPRTVLRKAKEMKEEFDMKTVQKINMV